MMFVYACMLQLNFEKYECIADHNACRGVCSYFIHEIRLTVPRQQLTLMEILKLNFNSFIEFKTRENLYLGMMGQYVLIIEHFIEVLKLFKLFYRLKFYSLFFDCNIGRDMSSHVLFYTRFYTILEFLSSVLQRVFPKRRFNRTCIFAVKKHQTKVTN